MRIGIGYDIHPLVEGRPLVLGGVRIEHPLGLLGHSDADALVHALCDALLGAAALGDIGMHFPETEEFRGISSLALLERVGAMLRERGYRLVNADCVVHAERPTLAPYRGAMAGAMARALGVDPGQIGVKATRGEGLGPVGEGRAVAASAVALIERAGGGGVSAPEGERR
ncbi:MAG: 2-C-methyl-D-erythritol 2,4-cyclodiphosphate synthase [Candidatus Krumholzibacteria bacterium]|nr:2-C-methyl-D-erythritol 2,4-cyclodiphosphate synthase [Candidatus Krumholzibacteria bacterium]